MLADHDMAVMRDYFHLGIDLTAMADQWARQDKRYAEVHRNIFGARMLRQDPVECTFEFICSSNNHISRIGGMVEHLCRAYGTPLPPVGVPSV